MNAVLEKVISGIRRKQALSVKTGLTSYHDDFVTPIAQGKNVDTSALTDLLDELEIDESQLQSDVECKAQRFEYAEKLKLLTGVSARIKQATQEQQKLLAERTAAVEKLNVKIFALGGELRELEHKRTQFADLEQRLVSTVIDPVIKARESELRVRQRELSKERTRLNSDHSAHHLEQHTEGLASLKAKYAEVDVLSPGVRQALSERIKKAKAYVDHFKPLAKQAEKASAELNAEIAKLDSEFESLRIEKLKP